mgnify:CR=1 FL=1
MGAPAVQDASARRAAGLSIKRVVGLPGLALEATMDPQVLAGRGADHGFDFPHHARGVGRRIGRREVIEHRREPQGVVAVIVAHVRKAHDRGTGQARELVGGGEAALSVYGKYFLYIKFYFLQIFFNYLF